MRVSFPRAQVRRVLRWAQTAAFTGALAALSYCAFVMVDAWYFERSEGRRLDEMLLARSVTTPSAAVMMDGLVGRLEIPRLGISVMVIEGTNSTVLRRAAGHITGTRLPGQVGNIGISAHRDTFFRPLRNVRAHDLVTLTTLAGSYHYTVISTEIVQPEDMSVLNDSASEVLTLLTCYPFYFVGDAPQRFIVRAERNRLQD